MDDRRLPRLLAQLGDALGDFRIGPSDEVAVAYSGGADSLSLLLLLTRLPAERRPALVAFCVDHNLRPDSGDATAAALALGRSLGVRTEGLSVVVEGKGGVEAAARHARYRALAEAAAGRPILTAHTLDDQAETVLLRALRGTGPDGLAGIRPSFRLHGARILRPLLGMRRADLRELLVQEGLEPVEDSTNAELHYARNRLRHEVLPLLDSLAPAPLQALARLAELARADARYLQARAARAKARLRTEGGLSVGPLLRLPRALASRVIRLHLHELGESAPAWRIDEILSLARRGGELHLPRGILVRVSGGVLSIGPGATGRPSSAPSREPRASKPVDGG